MRKLLTYRTVLAIALLAYVAAALSSLPPSSCAAAYDDPRDFCLVTEITITNTSSTDLTDQWVRVLFPAKSLIGGDQLDPRGWDAYPVLGAANNEIDLFQQSTDSTQAPYWLFLEELPAGASRTVSMFSGSGEVRSDNEIKFTGNEVVYINDTGVSDFDITDNLRIDVFLTVETDDEVSGTLVIKGTSSDHAYGIELLDLGPSSQYIRVRHGTGAFSYGPVTFTGERQHLAVEMIAAAGDDVFIYLDGALVFDTDRDFGALPTNNLRLAIGGQQLTPDLADVSISEVVVSEAGVPVGHWGFDAHRTSETSSTNPYTGTTEDYSGNGNTLTYSFDRDQSAIDFSVGVISPNNFDPVLNLNEGNSVVGAPVPTDFATPRATASSGIVRTNFIDPLQDISAATGAPADGVVAATAFAVSLVLAIIVFRLTRGYMPAAVLTLGIGPTIAVIMGFAPEWWLLIWGLTVAVVWFAQLRSQQES